MKIASRIKPKSGSTRTVTAHGKPYVFTATVGKDDEIHFVADVKEDKAAETFMSHEAFYAYGIEHQQQTQLKREAPPEQQPKAPVAIKPDVLAAATELLQGSASEISKAIGKSNAEVIQAAIALESAQANPRKNALSVLTMALEGIKSAGVQK
jgi:hypothetical protein